MTQLRSPSIYKLLQLLIGKMYALMLKCAQLQILSIRAKSRMVTAFSLCLRRFRKVHKILFICHGNICRSPIAEFLLRATLILPMMISWKALPASCRNLVTNSKSHSPLKLQSYSNLFQLQTSIQGYLRSKIGAVARINGSLHIFF